MKRIMVSLFLIVFVVCAVAVMAGAEIINSDEKYIAEEDDSEYPSNIYEEGDYYPESDYSEEEMMPEEPVNPDTENVNPEE